MHLPLAVGGLQLLFGHLHAHACMGSAFGRRCVGILRLARRPRNNAQSA